MKYRIIECDDGYFRIEKKLWISGWVNINFMRQGYQPSPDFKTIADAEDYIKDYEKPTKVIKIIDG